MPVRQLPAHPDLNQLKHQAKDLLHAFRQGDPAALADFLAYHGDGVDATSAKLSDAQLVLARSYHCSSWPKLVAVCELMDAISRDDFRGTQHLLLTHDEIVRDVAATPTASWCVALAECANDALRRIVGKLRQGGARDVDAALQRPELHPALDALKVLGKVGARFPKDVIGGAVETLTGSTFAFMVDAGTDIEDEHGDWRSRVALALETYARKPDGKHRILETMASAGIPLPDTAPMALHRGRTDLLEAWLARDASLWHRTFSHDEIFPAELGCHDDHALALVGTPLDGGTLLHMAAEYEDLDVVRWLLDQGAPVDARAAVDADGFGGHTALFHCVVSYNAGRRDDRIAQLLLDRGADPNVRASLRHRLPFAADTSTHEYRDVTALGWATRFHDQSYVSPPNVRVILERGGAQ